ncbi:hypothetical protein TRIP_D440162 [uncultured Paludibacter sp.]|nr:hypothetical protein TRIP_D440162 [uncultured Paludibacter sp.]
MKHWYYYQRYTKIRFFLFGKFVTLVFAADKFVYEKRIYQIKHPYNYRFAFLKRGAKLYVLLKGTLTTEALNIADISSYILLLSSFHTKNNFI